MPEGMHLLWDVDGTLVRTGDSRNLYAEVAATLTGAPTDTVWPEREGKVDRQILLEHLAAAGGEPSMYAEAYEQLRTLSWKVYLNDGRRERLPHAWPAIIWAEEQGHTNSLFTGNSEQRACAKLHGAQLPWTRFRIWDSFFGDSHDTRPQMAEAAATRFAGKQTVIIGDTPRDIQAARHGGFHVIAVATGPHTVEELRNEQPDAVIATLNTLPEALTHLLRRL